MPFGWSPTRGELGGSSICDHQTGPHMFRARSSQTPARPHRRPPAALVTLALAGVVSALLLGVPLGHAGADGVDTVDEITANYGDTPGTTMWLHWRGAQTQVAYGVDTGYGSVATGTPPPVTPVDVAGPFYRVLLTGLTPGTVYHYRIGPTGADHQFETAPTGDFTWDDIGDTGSTYYVARLRRPAATGRTWPRTGRSWPPTTRTCTRTAATSRTRTSAATRRSHQIWDDIAPVGQQRPDRVRAGQPRVRRRAREPAAGHRAGLAEQLQEPLGDVAPADAAERRGQADRAPGLRGQRA